MDKVLTRRKFRVAYMELKWDLNFEVVYDLRLRLARNHRQSKYQSAKERQQVLPAGHLAACKRIAAGFIEHRNFSSFSVADERILASCDTMRIGNRVAKHLRL